MITLTFHLKTGPSEEIHTTSDLQTIALLQIKIRDARASGDRALVLRTDLQERPSKTVAVLHLQVLRLLSGNSNYRDRPSPTSRQESATHSFTSQSSKDSLRRKTVSADKKVL